MDIILFCSQSPCCIDKHIISFGMGVGGFDVQVLARKEVQALKIIRIPEELSVGADYGLLVRDGAFNEAWRLDMYILSPEGQKILRSNLTLSTIFKGSFSSLNGKNMWAITMHLIVELYDTMAGLAMRSHFPRLIEPFPQKHDRPVQDTYVLLSLNFRKFHKILPSFTVNL